MPWYGCWNALLKFINRKPEYFLKVFTKYCLWSRVKSTGGSTVCTSVQRCSIVYIEILNYIFFVGWPDEASRNLYIKATQEIPLLQDTLCHIFVIGISKQHPINGRDIIDLVDVLVKRAAGLHPLIADDFQVCIY